MSAAIRTSRPLTAAHFPPQPRMLVSALPAASRLGQRLAEAAAMVFGSIAATPWRAAADRIEDRPDALPDGAGQWLRLESRMGSMTVNLALDRPAIAALCEAAMGGAGSEPPWEFPDRPLSRIESGLARLALSKLKPRVAIAFSEQLETTVSQFDIPDGDVPAEPRDPVAFRLLLNVFGHSGEVRLTAARSELAAQLGEPSSTGQPDDLTEDNTAALQRELGKAGVTFTIMMEAEAMCVEDLVGLMPGRLLKLAATTASPVHVTSEAGAVYSAMLARSGEHLAVRILAPAG